MSVNGGNSKGDSRASSMTASDDQRQIAEAVARFVRERYGYRDWRRIVDAEPGIDQARWLEMAETGWLGIGLPEDVGGSGGSLGDALAAVEELAVGLVAEPLASTVLVCGDLIDQAGTPEQRHRYLPAVIGGRLRLALAHEERDRADPSCFVRTQACRHGPGWRLTGSKRMVIDAPHADVLLVTARVSDEDLPRLEAQPNDERGLAVFLVDARAPGLRRQNLRTFDRRRASNIELDGLTVSPDSILGLPGGGARLIRRAEHRSIAGLCAEAAGLGRALLEATQSHLSSREQFGAKLASFQVLQHRLVDMHVALEEIRTASRLAALAAEADDAAMVSSAKVKVSQAGQFLGRQAVQLHGAMGMTDEMPIGDFLKRLEAIALLHGDADQHLDLLARASWGPAAFA